MTRDEAVDVACKAKLPWNSSEQMLVDTLAGLGLLKLDEPKTPEQMLRDVLPREGYVWGPSIPDVIASAGLRVVRA